MAESFYNTAKFEQRNRSIRLNEIKQELPSGALRVVDCKKQKALNNPTLEYPILILEDDDGNKYDVMAWERDVAKCGQQWGAVDPKGWGLVAFQLCSTGTRWEIVPAGEAPLEEEMPLRKTKVRG